MLLRSVQKRLEGDETVHHAAFMWSRHRWMTGYALFGFLALLIVAVVVGFESWPSRIGVGLAGGAIAANATTSYYVLAETNKGFVLLKASKVRQYAVEFLERLGPTVALARVGSNMFANDWTIGQRRFTVAKSSDASMTLMSSP